MARLLVSSTTAFLIGSVAWALALPAVIQEPEVTIYSINKHRAEHRNFCFNFQGGASTSFYALCDLRYGALYVGDELDWFESSGSRGNRSVIKDLGAHSWNQDFRAPVVEPLAKLKPGEQRHVTIDASGADGADGAPGTPGSPGADADGVVRERLPADIADSRISTPPRPKRNGEPRVDPMFVKAIVGHLYVIHVVDDTRDFYALFRVEALERGDNCTISWKLIEAPTPAP